MRRRREWNERLGAYEISVELPRDPATGARRQRRIRGKRWEDVERKRDDLLAKQSAGTFVDPSTVTVGDWLHAWLETVDVRENTRASYRRTMEHRVIAHLGTRQLQQLNTAELTALYARLAKDGALNGGPLSARSVQYTATVLHHALAEAERQGLIGHNPARAARKPKARQALRDDVVWTPGELAAFLELVRDDLLYHALFRVFGLCGLRRSEALGLPWSAVDFDGEQLAVKQRLVMVERRFDIDEPKTERGRRTLDVDAKTLAALRTWKAAQGQERLRVGVGWKNELGLVFTWADGRPLRPNSTGTRFDQLVGESGLPKIRLHDLRHGHATHLLAAGTNPVVVSQRMGHGSVAFTLSRYAHVMPGQQKDASDAVARLVGGAS